jgi:hypothetical protein
MHAAGRLADPSEANQGLHRGQISTRTHASLWRPTKSRNGPERDFKGKALSLNYTSLSLAQENKKNKKTRRLRFSKKNSSTFGTYRAHDCSSCFPSGSS